MDPDTALRDMREAYAMGDWEGVAEAANNLDIWLSGGGFLPDNWDTKPKVSQPLIAIDLDHLEDVVGTSCEQHAEPVATCSRCVLANVVRHAKEQVGG